MPTTGTTRKWQVFPGRNKFCCDGRLMMAQQTGIFSFTVSLILLTSALFFAFDCPYLTTNITVAIPIVGSLLFIFVMSTLFWTSFSDPGVLPRATPDEAADIEKQIEVPNGSSTLYRPPPRAKEILIRGVPMKLKYCFTCKIFRPPRASHCSLCDNCVDRFDHHCPWVGNCVGRRNYRYFYMFLISLAFYCVFVFACSATHLIMSSRSSTFVDAMKDSPASVVIGVICFFSIWSILGLAGFHTYLTSSNQTTNEDIKGLFSTKRGQGTINPFSYGNVCLNCFYVVCGPTPPSLIDRRGFVTPDMENSRTTELVQTEQPNHQGEPAAAVTQRNDSVLVVPPGIHPKKKLPTPALNGSASLSYVDNRSAASAFAEQNPNEHALKIEQNQADASCNSHDGQSKGAIEMVRGGSAVIETPPAYTIGASPSYNPVARSGVNIPAANGKAYPLTTQSVAALNYSHHSSRLLNSSGTHSSSQAYLLENTSNSASTLEVDSMEEGSQIGLLQLSTV